MNPEDGRFTGMRQAEALLDLGRPAEAKALLLQQIGPGDLDVHGWCLVARCHLALHEWALAQFASDRAIRTDPEGEWAYRLRSMALRGQGAMDQSVAAAQEAVRLAPHLWPTHVCLAGALSEVPGRRQEALAAANRAVDLAPTQAECHFARGLALAAMGRDEDAAAAYEKALELDPQNSNARNNLGVLALRSRKVGRAAEHFTSAVVADPQNQTAAKNVTIAARVRIRRVLLVIWVAALLLGLLMSLQASNGEVGPVWKLVPYVALALSLGAVAVVLRRSPPGFLRFLARDRMGRWTLASLVITVGFVFYFPLAAEDPDANLLPIAVELLLLQVGVLIVLGARSRSRRRQ